MADTTENNPPAVITLRDLYRMMTEVKDTVAGVPDMREDIKDHEARLRVLERWIWRASGFSAIGGAGITLAISTAIERL